MAERLHGDQFSRSREPRARIVEQQGEYKFPHVLTNGKPTALRAPNESEHGTLDCETNLSVANEHTMQALGQILFHVKSQLHVGNKKVARFECVDKRRSASAIKPAECNVQITQA